MIRAYLKSLAYIRDHQDEVVQFMMKQFSLEKDIASRVMEGMQGKFSFDGSVTDEGLKGLLEVAKLGGGPAAQNTLEQLKAGLDLSLLSQVQKEGGLSR